MAKRLIIQPSTILWIFALAFALSGCKNGIPKVSITEPATNPNGPHVPLTSTKMGLSVASGNVQDGGGNHFKFTLGYNPTGPKVTDSTNTNFRPSTAGVLNEK